MSPYNFIPEVRRELALPQRVEIHDATLRDGEAIKRISELGLKSRIFTFARAMKQDIDKALECGADGVIIEVPIGYPKLKTQFGWTWKDVLDKSAPAINFLKANAG